MAERSGPKILKPKKPKELKRIELGGRKDICKVEPISKVMANMSPEELLLRLTPETAAMLAQKHIPNDAIAYQRLNIKISKNTGCVSLYGISKHPLNLYANQWIKVWHVIDDVIDFIKVNDRWLKKKS